MRVTAAIARGEQIRQTNPDTVQQSERPPEYKELAEVFRGIQDVGAGTDCISPAVLRFLADRPEPNDGFGCDLKAREEQAKKQCFQGRAMWGVPLPRVQRRGAVGVANPRPTAPLAMAADPGAVLREGDYLPCLFFADDRVLIALDRETLHAMTDDFAESLAEVGLFLNAGKTKRMVVAPADMPREAYETSETLCAAQRERPLMVGDKTVELYKKSVTLAQFSSGVGTGQRRGKPFKTVRKPCWARRWPVASVFFSFFFFFTVSLAARMIGACSTG
jgi:hypothetical protein